MQEEPTDLIAQLAKQLGRKAQGGVVDEERGVMVDNTPSLCAVMLSRSQDAIMFALPATALPPACVF